MNNIGKLISVAILMIAMAIAMLQSIAAVQPTQNYGFIGSAVVFGICFLAAFFYWLDELTGHGHAEKDQKPSEPNEKTEADDEQ